MDTATDTSKDDAYVVHRRLRNTTNGWKLLVNCKNGSESWVTLKKLKESLPVDLAEYAKARVIVDEPVFAWWVPCTMRKRDTIISVVKPCQRKISHKYGIELHTSVKHAYE